MHPEVKYVGLLTSLYAGTSLLKGFKHSTWISIVKELKQRRKSAGNIYSCLRSRADKTNIIDGTSETVRDEIVVNSEHVKTISDHIPKHVKPLDNEQLGHYLAGLIDGDGHFSKAQQLVIVFSSADAFLAYYLKKSLGYGNVKKVKNKNAYILIIAKKEGILNVINLINGKLRTEDKFNQVTNNVLNHTKYEDICINFTINSTSDLNNHWLAGFSDADASFQIKVISRVTRNKAEIRLNYQIDQKNHLVLNMIKNYLGGNVGYRESQDTYYYGSTSFGSAKKVIGYFDKFNLQSKKHISYLRWRKVYRFIQNGEHLTEKGVTKILTIKSLMNRHE